MNNYPVFLIYNDSVFRVEVTGRRRFMRVSQDDGFYTGKYSFGTDALFNFLNKEQPTDDLLIDRLGGYCRRHRTKTTRNRNLPTV